MLVGLISDTHITEKRGKLSQKVFDAFEGVDLIVHAGDITQQKVIDEMESIAPVIAVLGNNDKLNLNKTEIIEAENFKIAVNHGTRYSNDFDKLYAFANELDADILITGHTHKPHCKVIGDVLLINPGSCSRPIQSEKSIAVLDIDGKNKSLDDIGIDFVKL